MILYRLIALYQYLYQQRSVQIYSETIAFRARLVAYRYGSPYRRDNDDDDGGVKSTQSTSVVSIDECFWLKISE